MHIFMYIYIAEQDKAIAFCHQKLSALGVTGRLRIGREVHTTPNPFNNGLLLSTVLPMTFTSRGLIPPSPAPILVFAPSLSHSR